MPVDIAQLSLERAAFEVRYAQSLQLWDRAGLLWSRIENHNEQFELKEVSPSKVQAVVAKRFVITVELEKFTIVDNKPEQSLDLLRRLSHEHLQLISSVLEIDNFIRIGVRFFFYKEYGSPEDATREVLSKTIFNEVEGRHMNIDFAPKYADYSFRNEGEFTGYRCHVKSQTQKIEFDSEISEQWAQVEANDQKRHVLLFDLDYFTTQPTATEQFYANDWLTQVLHMLRRDGNFFLRGTL